MLEIARNTRNKSIARTEQEQNTHLTCGAYLPPQKGTLSWQFIDITQIFSPLLLLVRYTQWTIKNSESHPELYYNQNLLYYYRLDTILFRWTGNHGFSLQGTLLCWSLRLRQVLSDFQVRFNLAVYTYIHMVYIRMYMNSYMCVCTHIDVCTHIHILTSVWHALLSSSKQIKQLTS